MSSRVRALQEEFDDDSLCLIHVEPDGDCFYDCVAQCLNCDSTSNNNSSSSHHSIQTLRDTVASETTIDQLELFNIANNAGLEGYEFMNTNPALPLLQAMLRLKKQVYADEFAIRTISRVYEVVILILDEETQKRKRGQSQSNADNRFVAIDDTSLNSPRFMVLQRTRRQHFNLMKFASQIIFTHNTLPDQVMKKFLQKI
ncbi:hypothetical protein ScalyP_jg3946 [Parmales sp. scaly parma]|nr:hypothetical protein ScalyP_jg3946 [Parmales sp. scaly parma]